MEEIPNSAIALGKTTSGLFIVTAIHGAIREGYLASWIQQTSFSPLMISLAMKPGRPCYDIIKTQGRFCVNIIGQKNGGVMKPFWSPNSSADAFLGIDHFISERGNLILKGAMAALECEFRSSVTPGDHEIVFAEVLEGHIIQADDKPLAHVRKSALSY
jgi:flavin reductase (DIM6/NTAB) family NADH-FMN oxidoreductase RutF